MEMGKPPAQSIAEVHGVAYVYRYFAGAAIIPWNGLLIMVAWKTAPALATGHASIIKTNEKSPLSALLFSALVGRAGIPDGILSILSGVRETGELLSLHMRIRKISFTGSALAGRAVAQAAARSNRNACTLYLGGKSPIIVFDDCDIEDAVTRVLGSFNRHAGQICVAGTRFYVKHSIFDQFAQKLAADTERYSIGDPLQQATSSGPQVDSIQHKRIIDYIELGKSEGGKILTGGIAGDAWGYYVKPTIFTDVQDQAMINQEEIFGPVVILHKFSSSEEVLKRANDTEYGLVA